MNRFDKIQTAFWMIVAAAMIAVLWFTNQASGMTPSEYLASMVKEALVTNNQHAYQVKRSVGSWEVLIFNIYGMTWTTVPDASWPKRVIVRHAHVPKKDNVVQAAVAGYGIWQKGKCPMWMATQNIDIQNAQQFLNGVLDGKLQMYHTYGTHEGNINSFWLDVVAPIIDRPEYNKTPDKPKVEMSI